MPWYSTFDAVFWTGIATMFFGFLGISIKTALASKCDSVDCWCIKVHRRVELETELKDKKDDPPVPEKIEKVEPKNNMV